MQLLSFLSEIGEALIKQSVADMGPTWEISRMVNYHQGLGRMVLTPPAGADETQMRGTIYIQTFQLADGSLCLKANLHWQGTEQSSTITVFSKPGLNWRSSTKQIAATWLAGPPASTAAAAKPDAEWNPGEMENLLRQAAAN